MMDEMTQRMKVLTECDGVPGHEGAVRSQMKSYLEPLSEELVMDRLGSVFGVKTGLAGGPKVMLAEIGRAHV